MSMVRRRTMVWLMRRMTRLTMMIVAAAAPGALLGVHRAGVVGVLLHWSLMLLYWQYTNE